MARKSYIWIDGLWDRIDEEIYKQHRTKSEVARQCGFDRRTLVHSMDKDNISLPYFARLCSELHVSADYLLFGKKNNKLES